MNILDNIIAFKKKEVAEQKKNIKQQQFERQLFFNRPVISLKEKLLDPVSTGIIAEFKRKSPSKGEINIHARVEDVVLDYQRYGATAVSVLTDHNFFGGSAEDLVSARAAIQIPILRKEFIIDEYQIIEAKAIGADLILLIAACLTPVEVSTLSRFAVSIGLEVLLELHEEEEIGHICDDTVMIGINNRSLKTFDVDIERSIRMSEKIPARRIKIAESGISSVDDILLFREHQYRGFLIGENFMKEKIPGDAFRIFTEQLKEVSINEN